MKDRPKSGRVYRLTGGPNSIANGDSWAHSEVTRVSSAMRVGCDPTLGVAITPDGRVVLYLASHYDRESGEISGPVFELPDTAAFYKLGYSKPSK